MKKLFTSFVAAGAVASFAACAKPAKPAATTETQVEATASETTTTTQTVVNGPAAKGTFKIGFVSSEPLKALTFKNTLTDYTQDVANKADTGDEYFNLPSGLSLISSEEFNSFEIADQIEKLRDGIKSMIPFATSTPYETSNRVQASGGDTTTYNGGGWISSSSANVPRLFLYTNTGIMPTTADFDAIFTDEVLGKIYKNLTTTTPNAKKIYAAFKAAGVNIVEPTPGKQGSGLSISQKIFDEYWDVESEKINNGPAVLIDYRRSGPPIGPIIDSGVLFSELITSGATQKALEDKTQLASKNLDALFINVTDGVENSSGVYKSVVEKQEFGNTKLFFVGEKAKTQDGSSSKTFAGGNISTASFNKYAAAYVAGFQAAAGAIKYSSEDMFEETTVAFLIGSTDDSTAKKKAFAFRRGVEAAAAHAEYSKFLKVKFVSKTNDSSKSSKKLYRSVGDWTNVDDSKSKLYEFTSSDTFTDADRKIVYLAGTTSSDWKGTSATDTIQVKSTASGLVDALYNYDASKSSKGIWLVLDHVDLDDTTSFKTQLEKAEVKFMGFVGSETSGTQQYLKAALEGLYMGGPNYMLGKHTIFGAALDISNTSGLVENPDSDVIDAFEYHSNAADRNIWSASEEAKEAKAQARFEKSLSLAWETEVTEDELVKDSPWMK